MCAALIRSSHHKFRIIIGAVHKVRHARGWVGVGVSVTKRYMGVGGYSADRYVTLILNFICFQPLD